MKVLVIGGSGFLGRNFLLRCSPDWECHATYNKSLDFPDFVKSNSLNNVLPMRINLENTEDVKALLKNNRFDICFYAMGHSQMAESSINPLVDIGPNLIALNNVIQNVSIGKFIYISSGAVYEGQKGLVDHKEMIAPTIPYAISKYAAERYIAHYQKNTDHIDEFICLRFFGAYGPMEASRKIYTKLIKSLSIDKSIEFIMNGDGKNYIDAMYIDDAIDGILKIIESNKSNLVMDYCYGSPLTLTELVNTIGSILEIPGFSIKHIGKSAEYTTFYAATNEIESLFNFKPKVSLKEGIIKFRNHLLSGV